MDLRKLFWVHNHVYYTLYAVKNFGISNIMVKYYGDSLLCTTKPAYGNFLEGTDLESCNKLAKGIIVSEVETISDSSVVQSVELVNLATGTSYKIPRYNSDGVLGDYITRLKGSVSPNYIEYQRAISSFFGVPYDRDSATKRAITPIHSSQISITEPTYNLDKSQAVEESNVQIKKTNLGPNGFVLDSDEDAFVVPGLLELNFLLFLYNLYSCTGFQARLESKLNDVINSNNLELIVNDNVVYASVKGVNLSETNVLEPFKTNLVEGLFTESSYAGIVTHPVRGWKSGALHAVSNLDWFKPVVKRFSGNVNYSDEQFDYFWVGVHGVLDFQKHLVSAGLYDSIFKRFRSSLNPYQYFMILALNYTHFVNSDGFKNLIIGSDGQFNNAFGTTYFFLPVVANSYGIYPFSFDQDKDMLVPLSSELINYEGDFNKRFFLDNVENVAFVAPLASRVTVKPYYSLLDCLNRASYFLAFFSEFYGKVANKDIGVEYGRLPVGITPYSGVQVLADNSVEIQLPTKLNNIQIVDDIISNDEKFSMITSDKAIREFFADEKIEEFEGMFLVNNIESDSPYIQGS